MNWIKILEGDLLMPEANNPPPILGPSNMQMVRCKFGGGFIDALGQKSPSDFTTG
jgi:hypothetical protein